MQSLKGALIVVVCALIGCGPSSPGGETSGGQGSGSPDAAGQDPDARGGGGGGGGGGNEFADAAPIPTCGVQEEDIEVVNNGEPPDLLIVLDRSSSMSSVLDIFDLFGPNKWDVMVEALQTITTNQDGNIRFGLTVFPTDDTCGVTAGTEVAVADSTASAIDTWLTTAEPGGNTPAHLALQNALDVYNSMPVNPNGRFVLFATDGEPNCGGDASTGSDAEVVLAVEALRAAGVDTFVLGYGAALGLDATNLNDAALAGGVPRPGGPPHFYEADSAADLQSALDAIAGGIIQPSCEYELTENPPDPDAVTVTIDGTPVPRSPSHTDGWDYHPDSSHITFFGSYCDLIQGGSSGNVSFSFGCAGPVID